MHRIDKILGEIRAIVKRSTFGRVPVPAVVQALAVKGYDIKRHNFPVFMDRHGLRKNLIIRTGRKGGVQFFSPEANQDKRCGSCPYVRIASNMTLQDRF